MPENQKTGRAADRRIDEWQNDLNPDRMAGQNTGPESAQPEKEAPTAHDIKALYDRLADFSAAELKQIPILPQGSRLKQGATYLDLNSPERQDFTAMGDMEAGPDDYYVPKTEVSYMIWNRLTGVQDPERLDT